MTIQIIESGTREGALKAWDKRGRGRKKKPENIYYYDFPLGTYNKARNKDWKKLSQEERDALLGYTKLQYVDINRYLRNKDEERLRNQKRTLNGEKVPLKDYIGYIDSAIAKGTPLEANTYLYRVISKRPEWQKVGVTFTDLGFVSTSVDIDTPAKIYPSKKVYYRIKAPKGTKGIFASSDNPREFEFLLPRGTKFKVTGITGESIDLDIVND